MFLDDFSVLVVALGLWSLNQAWYGRRLRRRYDNQTLMSMTSIDDDEKQEAMSIRRKKTTRQAFLYHRQLQIAGYVLCGVGALIWGLLFATGSLN